MGFIYGGVKELMVGIVVPIYVIPVWQEVIIILLLINRYCMGILML